MSNNREPASHGATILVVEDEASVRNLVTRFLTLSGFRVFVAEDGIRAQSLWARHKQEVDLLLTDVVMPGNLSGRALANQFQAERPALKVLFTSGYSPESLNAEGLLGDEVHFVQKPYRPEQLLAAVRAVLAGTFDPHAETLC